MNTKTKLPSWFNGQCYTHGSEVTNRYSGESYKLTAEELSMYDFIVGTELVLSMGLNDEKMIKDMRKGLDWFRTHNAEAYMVLLD
jgi:hypothetical protein